MKPVVLFRGSLAEEGELQACKNHFPIITHRSEVCNEDLIIPRYSCLPYYKEFEQDVKNSGGMVLNTYRQHNYVADLQNWYYDVEEYTPKTWFYLENIPEEGPFVLKGATNSKKFNWCSHMYAKNKKEAIEVYSRLSEDGFIGTQDIYIREYVPLRKFIDGIQGMPVTEEYRFFVLDGKIMAGGFYWSEHIDYIKKKGFTPNIDYVPSIFLEKVISCVKDNIRFFVLDIARTENGDWVVIELNDGQMSGLSDVNPDELYVNMISHLRKK